MAWTRLTKPPFAVTLMLLISYGKGTDMHAAAEAARRQAIPAGVVLMALLALVVAVIAASHGIHPHLGAMHYEGKTG